jgi:hypothetical protein
MPVEHRAQCGGALRRRRGFAIATAIATAIPTMAKQVCGRHGTAP